MSAESVNIIFCRFYFFPDYIAIWFLYICYIFSINYSSRKFSKQTLNARLDFSFCIDDLGTSHSSHMKKNREVMNFKVLVASVPEA